MNKKYDVGVVVGRFQVPELHDGHIKLIKTVLGRHDRLIIFVGTTTVLGSKENPLDFETIASMIRSYFPYYIITVLPLPDFKSDIIWSKNLDNEIKKLYPKSSVCLYGCRDSFIEYYHGEFKCEELPSIDHISGNEIRNMIGKNSINSSDFRKGVIYSTQNNYPKIYPTVDVAIIKQETGELLLGRKPNEKEYRFIGGFVGHESLEAAARREAEEETGATVDGLKYINSYAIEDWRYKKCSDKIVTSFFMAYYIFGCIEARDDIKEVKWFKLSEVNEGILVENHRIMLQDLKKFMNKEDI